MTDYCRECGMPVGPVEYHPYAACVMYRQLGQGDSEHSADASRIRAEIAREALGRD